MDIHNTKLIHPSPVTARLQQLRQVMQREKIAAYIVPSADPHLSEYLPGRWQGRAWLSGFNGSVGTLIVTADFAGLWADSRYWTQAEAELAGSGIALMKISSGGSVQHIDWLAVSLGSGQTVAVDGAVLGLATARALQQALDAKGITLRTDLDLLNEIWRDRPGLPDAPVYQHLPPQATVSRAAKLSLLREAMRSAGVQQHFISTVDDIGYLFNLRGADVSYNPVFVAHALIDLEHATLFVAEGKIDAALQAILAQDQVSVAPYQQAAAVLAALSPQSKILIDPRRVTYGLRQAMAATVVEAINPTTLAKSRKSEAEAGFVRQTMEQDGAALCDFF
ncbi:MAG: hypothetical protein RL748_645, partial [Pseudomonadota bacterium]